NFEKLLSILSSNPNPYSALEGRARAESQAGVGIGSGDRNPRSRRIASPVRASGSLMKSLKMQGRRTFCEPQGGHAAAESGCMTPWNLTPSDMNAVEKYSRGNRHERL